MAKKNVKKAGKVKGKKRWLPVIAPKSFESVALGECYVERPEQAVGKTIRTNLMTLTGDMRRQVIEIRFDVVKVGEGKALTAVTGYELLPSGVKRLVRRGRSKVDDSFLVKSATGRLVRIKPLIITANPASERACSALRLTTRERLKQLVSSFSFDKLVQELVHGRIQRALKEPLNKIHPIKTIDIRMCLLLPEGTREERAVREDSKEEDFSEEKGAGKKEGASRPAKEETPESRKEAVKSREAAPDAQGAARKGAEEGVPRAEKKEKGEQKGTVEKEESPAKRAEAGGKSAERSEKESGDAEGSVEERGREEEGDRGESVAGKEEAGAGESGAGTAGTNESGEEKGR